MKLYYHPLSPNCHKVLLALYEKGIECDLEEVDIMNPEAQAQYKKDVYEIGKVPFLKLDDWAIPESSIIIEYLDTHFEGPTLIPKDPDLARRARFHDRMADHYLIYAASDIWFENKRPESARHRDLIAYREEHIRVSLDFSEEMGGSGPFILGDRFTLADLTTSVGLNLLQAMMGYNLADWPKVQAYLARILERPSWQKVLEGAQSAMAAMEA